MATPAPSEANPGSGQDIGQAIEPSSIDIPHSPLSRRELLKLAGSLVPVAGYEYLKLVSFFKDRQNTRFLPFLDAVGELEINSNTIQKENPLGFAGNPTLSFISGNTELKPTDNQKANPDPRATKIEIKFKGESIKEVRNNNRTAKQLEEVIRGFIPLARIHKAVKHEGLYKGAAVFLGITEQLKTKWQNASPGEKRIAKVTGGTIAGGLFLLACNLAGELSQVQQTSTGHEATKQITALATDGEGGPTPQPPEGGNVEATVTPLPEIPENNFPGQNIDRNYLEQNAKIWSDSLITNNQDTSPLPTSVPPPESQPEQTEDPFDYAAKRFKIDLKSLKLDIERGKQLTSSDLLKLLKYTIAQGAYKGTNGGLTYFTPGTGEQIAAFGQLSYYREALEKIDNPNEPGEYTTGLIEGSNSYPPNLNLKYGKAEGTVSGPGFTIVGRGTDGNFVIAFEEYFPRDSEEFVEPRIRLAVITPQELGAISQQYLGTMEYYLDDSYKITFQGKTVELNTIDDELMKEIYRDAGAVWIERYTTKLDENGIVIEEKFHPEPAVPYPPDELLIALGANPKDTLSFAQGLRYVEKTNDKRIGHVRSKTVQALDQNGKLLFIGEINRNSKEWEWKPPNWKNLSEMISFYLGDSVMGNFDYYNSDFQKALTTNFTMLNPGSFMAHRFDLDRELSAHFLKLTQENDQSLVIQPLFWQLKLPKELYTTPPDEFKKWMRNRVTKVFEYIRPVEPGGKPTMLVIGNEFLFWRDPRDGHVDDPVKVLVDGVWVQSPLSKVFGNSVEALTEIYMMVDEEAGMRGLKEGTDYLPIYTHYDNHSNDGLGSTTALLVDKLNRVKEKVGERKGISSSDVLIAVGIQGNFFYKDLPFWIAPPPTVDQFKEAIETQKQIGPVIIFDLNIVGLTQQEKKIKYQEFIKAAIDSGCLGLTFWKALLSSKRPYESSDPVYEKNPADLFDPENHYSPIPGNGYDDITQTLLSVAKERNLIG